MEKQPLSRPAQVLIALDLESILVPEIWETVAERSGVEALRLTTRDLPDYDALMRQRISLLRKHRLRFKEIQGIVNSLEPLPGALDFLKWLQPLAPMVILSDTFHELATPLVAKLGRPLLLCNSLEIDEEGYISKYHLRIPDGKQEAVLAFQRLGYRVTAVGDSYNDMTMLANADVGILFLPPRNVAERFPEFQVVSGFEELKRVLSTILRSVPGRD